MIDFDEAFALVVDQARPLQGEYASVAEAHERILAAPVIAAVDSPPADVSAMDGYAVRHEDLPNLRLVGTSYPGAGFEGVMGPGECVRIFTGAPVPAGADSVVVQEVVRVDGDRVIVGSPSSSGRHIRSRGSDFRTGDTLLPQGRFLDARALVAAAGSDCADVEVWRRPRVSVLGTGDELAEPGTARMHPGTIPESVSIGVAAMATKWGGDVMARERLPDHPETIRHAASAALDRSDLLVVTGGASVGEKDYAKAVLSDLGLEFIFSKVSIKPGKPVWFGRVGTRLVLGLPGNPTSALVTARLFLAPLIRGMSGGDAGVAVCWRRALLASPIEACGDRETFVRGSWEGDAVVQVSNQDSSAQRALADAELLIRRRAGASPLAAGESVEIIDF